MAQMSLQKRKTYVFDTTTLINNPDIVFKLKGRIVVPLVVIGQLDGLKNNNNTATAQRARQASRAILEAQTKKTIEVINNFKKDISVLDSAADNKIIGTCLTLREQGEDVNLLTTDVNMQITARSMGIKAIEIEDRKKIIMDFIFNGILPLGIILTFLALVAIYAGIISAIVFALFLVLPSFSNKNHYDDDDDDYNILLDPLCSHIPGNIFNRRK